MALAFKHEEIAPRALKPALLELDGISRAAVEAHYRLYEGYVAKRNEILRALADDEWRADLKATGMAARGWAWTAYDWDEARLFNYLGDAQNTFPVWNATPLVALDVYEHAYFLDYQTDRASYIEAFFANLDWAVVNDWVDRYQIPTR
jgi:hypothetical protein